jgi:GMP synthase-like glutamine amidotransferase
MASPIVRIGLVDMNNGVPNQGMRCFRRILDRFEQRVRESNPGVVFQREELQPRNRGDIPRGPYDFVLSSGGPGSPREGIEKPWAAGYFQFLQDVFDHNQRDAATAPKLLAVCHSFELAVLHFGVARMERRDTLKFGLMPAYTTRAGREVDYLKPFQDRLFAWEYRWYQAVDPDFARLRELGGRILAEESREDGPAHKGDAVLALSFADGIDGTQFHPEADKPGVWEWMRMEEHAERLRAQYGEELYERMLRSLDDETRLARTHALFVPGWLTCRFNDFAQERGLVPLPTPELDLVEFRAEFGAGSPAWPDRAP